MFITSNIFINGFFLSFLIVHMLDQPKQNIEAVLWKHSVKKVS